MDRKRLEGLRALAGVPGWVAAAELRAAVFEIDRLRTALVVAQEDAALAGDEVRDLRATLTAAREEAALKDAEITLLRGALKTVAYHAHAHLTDDMVADFALIAETADAALGGA